MQVVMHSRRIENIWHICQQKAQTAQPASLFKDRMLALTSESWFKEVESITITAVVIGSDYYAAPTVRACLRQQMNGPWFAGGEQIDFIAKHLKTWIDSFVKKHLATPWPVVGADTC